MSAILTSSFAEREVVAREAERVVMLHARGDDGETVAFLNFADTEVRVSLPIPAGEWVKRVDADDETILGDGEIVVERRHSDGAVELTLPPYAVLLCERI